MDLGLTEDEFWALQPRQFDALLTRKRQEREHHELLAGIVASAVANFSFGGLKKPTVPADFMPSQFERRQQERSRERAARPKRISRKATANRLRAFFNQQMLSRDAGV